MTTTSSVAGLLLLSLAMASPGVLVVDDNEAVRGAVIMMLEQLGLAVDEVTNGQEGIEALRRRAYSLVVMDINMPLCDGIAATLVIRAMLAPEEQPIIVGLTGRATAAMREVALAAGMDEC